MDYFLIQVSLTFLPWTEIAAFYQCRHEVFALNQA